MAISSASEPRAAAVQPTPSVTRNIVANYLGSAWSALMLLAFIPLYIRFLGIEAYGLIGVFVLLQSWLSILDVGLTPMLSREMARLTAGAHTAQGIRNLVRSVEWVYGAIALAIVLTVALAAHWLATHWLRAERLSTDTVTQALMISGSAIAARWLCGLYREAISGLQRQVWLNGCTAFFATLRGAGAVAVLAWISPTIQAFFAYQATLLGLEALTLAREMRRILPTAPRAARFDWQALHAVRHFAGGMAVIAVLAVLLTQVDKLLLSRLLPLSEFGYYALAGTVAGALTVIVEPIRNATYPRLTQLVALGDRSALAEAYHSYSQLLTLMIVPVSLVLSLFAGHILLLWTRDATTTQAVAPLASLLVIGSMLNGLMHTPYTLQLAHGWTRLTLVTNLIAVLILVPGIYLAVSTKGAPGAAMMWIILNAGYVALAVPAMHRRLLPGEMWRWYREDVGIPATATCAVVALARLVFPDPTLERPLQGIFLVLAVAVLAQLAGILATPVGRQQAFRFRESLSALTCARRFDRSQATKNRN